MRKILFLTQQMFYPDASGGSERSNHQLLEKLHQLNWQVEVICTRAIRSPHFLRTFWRSLRQFRIPFPAILDQSLGYSCWRILGRFSSETRQLAFLENRLKQFKPDVVLGHNDLSCPLLKSAAEQGYPCFFFTRITPQLRQGIPIPENVHLIANSPFTASILAAIVNYEPEAILPFVERELYYVKDRQRRYITFINPVPQKGLDIAVQLARTLPDRQFLFVKGNWFFYQGVENQFLTEARTLPNVEIWEHQQDARRVYEVTDILLVPSQFEETFGRVILEAQINGIPVVAAKVAGIPYTLGQGGILVDPIDQIDGYISALEQLQDEQFYEKIAALALQNSYRPEFDLDYQVNKFVQLVERSRSNQGVEAKPS